MATMPTRPILIHPDPRLKAVATPVADISDELRRLADDMLETMYDAPGIGLAAPQIGEMARLIVLDCVKDKAQPPRPLAMFNPRVVAASDESSVYEEGCLSIPEISADVEQSDAVTLRWLDLSGEEREETFGGFPAVCVQHEIDHLNGRLYIDYLKPLRRQMITRKMQKLKRERSRA